MCSLRKTSARSAPNRPLVRAALPIFQPLEARRLLATCFVSGGVMTITGDESNENLTIAEDAAHKMVIKNGSTEINHAQCYVADTLSSINANLFGGNDMATVEFSVSASIRIFIR